MSTTVEGRLIAARYRITERLGAGAMGQVWAARDEVLRREVALKELLPPAGLPREELSRVVERTRREARAAAAVSSPSVLTVYDVLDHGELTWIVMERLPPRSLADRIEQEGRLPAPAAAAVGLGVLDALDAAHAVGVLHRDVKPGNVLWAADGRVVLADFGIAQVEWEPSLTDVGVVLGSPSYLAPERARGEAAGRPSDLWALGALLFVAVEGTPPFTGQGPLATLTAVVTDDVPPSPHAGLLRPAIEGLLHKDPAERLTSARVRPLLERARRAADTGSETAVLPLRASEQTAASAPPAPAPPRPGPALFSPPAEPPRSPATTGDPGRRRRRRGLLLAGAAALVAVPTVLATQLLPGPTEDGGSAGSAPASPSAPAEEAPATSSPGEGAPDPQAGDQPVEDQPVEDQPSGGEPAGGAEEPTAEEPTAEEPTAEEPTAEELAAAGLEPYTDESGFSLAVPAGWEVSVEEGGTEVYFRDPESSRFLLVGQTDEPAPDALEDSRAREPGLRDQTGYELLRLEPVTVDVAPDAADWEYRIGEGGGTHVLNRNLRVSDTSAYALFLSAPHETWDEERARFDLIAATFTPAG